MIQYKTLVKEGDIPAAGAIALLEALLETGTPFLILCEQSARSQMGLRNHMVQLGFPTFSEDCIYTSTMAAVSWIAKEYPSKIQAAYFGPRGLKNQLIESGFDLNATRPNWLFVAQDRNANRVDYNYALSFLLRGAILISTDSTAVGYQQGQIDFGAGAVVKLLEYASKQKALEFGRPSVMTLVYALKYMELTEKDCVFVGDDYPLDILPALRMKMDTAFVTNGQSLPDFAVNGNRHPKWIVENLYGLAR